MDDAQELGVERLSLERRKRTSGRAIDAIPQKRMSQACHMDADLVGSPGFQAAFDVRIISIP